MAYELALPMGCGIPPIFHVSPLKPKVGANVFVVPSLPDRSHELQVPETILDSKQIWRGGKVVYQLKKDVIQTHFK